MPKREVCYLIDVNGAVIWSDASDSPVALPDSRARWQAIWDARDTLAEIAHSHPVGPLAFSSEDETTMSAISAALARAPRFSVVAPGGMIVREHGEEQSIADEPAWAASLRRDSGMCAREREGE